MKTPAWLSPLAGLILFLGSAGCDRRQPTAGGQSLSHWLHEARRFSWFTFLNSTADEARNEAHRRLLEIGEPAVPGLVDLAFNDNPSISSDAVNTLCALGPRARNAVPGLVRLLDSRDQEHRHTAGLVLGCIGPDAAAAVPKLELWLEDHDPTTQRIAARSLARIGGDAHGALARVSRSGSPSARAVATASLVEATAPAGSRLDLAEDAMTDPAAAVRAAALGSLYARTREEAADQIDLVIDALSDPDETVREEARRSITRMRQSQKLSVAVLIELLRRGDPGTRADAAWHIGMPRVGEPAEPGVILAARDAMEDPDPAVRIYAARAVWALDRSRADEVLRAVRASLSSTGDLLHLITAARLLWEAGHDASMTRRLIETILQGDDHWRRREAMMLASEMGPDADPLRPILEAQLNDPDREIRDRARRALDRLDSEH